MRPSTCLSQAALAVHCCKAYVKINRKIENSTLSKIVTNEDFNLKLGTRDYVADVTHHAPLGSNRLSGCFSQIGEYDTFVTLLLSCPFFSILRPGRTVALILTLNGSNDVFPPKDGPFGVIWGKYSPKPPKWAYIYSFKPKRKKYIAISPELLIRRSDLRTEFRPRKALTAAILKIDMTSYFSGGCSDLDKIRQPVAKWHSDYGEMVEIKSGSRSPIRRTFVFRNQK